METIYETDIYEVSDTLQKILDKVDNCDLVELTPSEEKLWLKHFAYVISNQFTLTSDQLLNTYNRWLVTIEYYSDIDDTISL